MLSPRARAGITYESAPTHISTCPCPISAGSEPGFLGTVARLGTRDSIAFHAGSRLSSEPPRSFAMLTSHASPRDESGAIIETRPLYSGFQRSSQAFGWFGIRLGLY